MEEPKTWEEQWQIITKGGDITSKILLLILGKTLLFLFFSFLLGFGFILIAFATFLGVLWFFPYWQPAYDVVIKVANLTHAPKDLIRFHLPWYYVPILGLKAIAVLFMLYIGFDLLISQGLCNQNLICMLLIN